MRAKRPSPSPFSKNVLDAIDHRGGVLDRRDRVAEGDARPLWRFDMTLPCRRLGQKRPGGIASLVPVTRIGIDRRACGARPAPPRRAAPGRGRRCASACPPGRAAGSSPGPAACRGAPWRCLSSAAAVAVDRHGVEDQRHERRDHAVVVEVVRRRGHRGALAEAGAAAPPGSRACRCGCAWLATRITGPLEAREACRSRSRGAACRRPSSGRARSAGSSRVSPRATHERAHGTSSWGAALRSSRPRLMARAFSVRLRRKRRTAGDTPLCAACYRRRRVHVHG